MSQRKDSKSNEESARSSTDSMISTKTPNTQRSIQRRGIGRGSTAKLQKSGTDSGLEQTGSSQKTSLIDTRSVSSQSGRIDETDAQEKSTQIQVLSDAFSDAEDSPCSDKDDLDAVKYQFSNTNCLFFEEITPGSLKIFEYSVKFSATIPNIQQRLFFLSKKCSLILGTTLFSPPNTLYTTKLIIPENQIIQARILDENVTLNLSPVSSTCDMKLFFSCLLETLSNFFTYPSGYLPRSLMTSQYQFEVHPGEVIDIAEHELIVRCASDFMVQLGTVENIIEEVLVYNALMKLSEQVYKEVLERSLQKLVVLNTSNRQTYVIKALIWDDKTLVSPQILCRRLNSDQVKRIDPNLLSITGTRRTDSTISELSSGGVDRISSFIGAPVTGQQRQLALTRYKSMANQKLPKGFLESWGLLLKETAVLSNGVLLQTDNTLTVKPGSDPTTAKGWVNRLSDLRVIVPACVKNWIVLHEKGDDRLTMDMISVLMTNAPTIGIEMKQPRKRIFEHDTVEALNSVLCSSMDRDPDLQLVVVILRSSRTDLYRAVKRWGLLGYSRPILTQVITRDIARSVCYITEFSLSIITQINCKLGGALWALDTGIRNTMTIGLSLYTSTEGKDVIGFVSATNQLFTKWYSFAMFNGHVEFPFQFEEAIRRYGKNNLQQEPERVIILCHQLGDDSFSSFVEKHARHVYRGKVTVVHVEDPTSYNKLVVKYVTDDLRSELNLIQQKYIFIPQKAKTEIDMICCRVDIHDEGISLKALAGVIKQLKHIYYNVAGEVNLPAPILYAERCAEFVAETLDGEQSSALGETLFYL